MTATRDFQRLVVREANGRFESVSEVLPEPGEGQVLVRIHASGVNPLDLKIRASAAPHARHPLPATLGLDLAGTVEAVGAHTKVFKVGDQVFGMTGGVGGVQGSLAEYACVDADLLALKPTNLSMREAAALPLSIITAWEGIVEAANVGASHSVLVQGGAGGVGHIVVQIARARGARVFATGSSKNAELIETLGATPIDYGDESVERYVERLTSGRGFDIVYDTAGGSALDASFQAVRQRGHVVSCLGWGSHSLAALSMRSASYTGVFTLLPLLTGQDHARHGAILREAAMMIEAGTVRPILDAWHFDLNQAAEAYELLGSAKNVGKVVVSVLVD